MRGPSRQYTRGDAGTGDGRRIELLEPIDAGAAARGRSRSATCPSALPCSAWAACLINCGAVRYLPLPGCAGYYPVL